MYTIGRWTHLIAIFPTIKWVAAVLLVRQSIFPPLLHWQTASCKYGASVCLWLTLFFHPLPISLGLGQPLPQACSPTSILQLLVLRCKFFSGSASAPLSASSSSPVWPSLHLAVSCSCFVFGMKDVSSFRQTWICFLFSWMSGQHHLYHRVQITRVIFLLLLISNSGMQFWCCQVTPLKQCLINLPFLSHITH